MLLRRVSGLLPPLMSLNIQVNQWATLPFEARMLSISQVTSKEVENLTESVEMQPKKINKSMKAYLERAQEHSNFMKQQREEYQIGKRHLANMMGENPETFTQEDIDNAIEYLFPSGLFEKRARPLMKPPEEVFPQRKAAEFDETGRPFHFLFYTGKPNYYQALHDMVEHINDLYKFEDVMIRKGLKPDPNLELDLSGQQWISKEELEKKLVETLGDKDYNTIISTLERLSNLPYSYRVSDFIIQFRKPLMSQLQGFEVPKPQYDSEGKSIYYDIWKRATGDVTIKSPGTGKITINGQDITYFTDIQPREQKSRRLPDFNDIYSVSPDGKIINSDQICDK
ncbi:hypothetical protein NQ317_012812 [Molorchus minor]|uniref:28S ribosomal protein S9, mitochondrial n=1 Tax=Molorchus minor TaxID=1323400 RepID=A0ABQ9K6M0_9CUCU|nr:hypothetical protein NQ317_012812 [Molorchus minor]